MTGMSAAGAFSKEFVSAEQTLTAAGLLTLAHALGGIPKVVRLALVCQTAENGFSINDRAEIILNLTSNTNHGVSIVPDATNIVLRFGSHAEVFGLLNFTTGSNAAMTAANWKLEVAAWR